MILVDTSVWIDHFKGAEPGLERALDRDQVGSHPYVVEELALGSLKERDHVLGLLHNLHPFPLLTHVEVMAMIDGHRLWSRGLSSVDVHLLGSVLVSSAARLWTRDKRLIQACRDVGVACFPDPGG